MPLMEAGPQRFERIDLHMHSHHSDGVLSPTELVALAAARQVGLLAAAWTQERGGTPSPRLLLQGFRANLWSLLPIGIFFVGGVTLAVMGSSLVDGGKLLELMSNGAAMSEAELIDLRQRVPDLTIHPDLSSFADFLILRDRKAHGEDSPVATHMGELS